MPKVYYINITIKSDDYNIVLHVLLKVSYSYILQLLIQQVLDISVCSNCLALASTLVFVAMLTFLPPTMMATLAMGPLAPPPQTTFL